MALFNPLTYDESLKVWLDTDYEDIRTLCSTARATHDPNLAVFKSICDDPASWIMRAYQKLGVKHEDFWARSIVEQALDLPGETEGKRAQMRYVELVSRKNVTIDSLYFLNPHEVVRRAMFRNKGRVFDQALKVTRQSFRPDDQFFQTVKEELVENSTLLATQRGQNRYRQYHLGGTIEGNESFIRGLQGQPNGTLESLRGLLTAHHWDLAREMIDIYPLTTQTYFPIITLVFRSNNPSFINEMLDKHPPPWLPPPREIKELPTLAVISNPEVARLFFERMPSVSDYLRLMGRIHGLFHDLLYHGNVESIEAIQETFGRRLSEVPDEDDLNYFVLIITGPYGLVALEWLIDNGYNLSQIPLRDSDIFMSKAVEAYMKKIPRSQIEYRYPDVI